MIKKKENIYNKSLKDYFSFFYKLNNNKKKNIILVENFNYVPSIINQGFLANVLSELHDAKIVSYNNPVTTNDLIFYLRKIKKFFFSKNKNIYQFRKYFGSQEILTPKIKKKKINIHFKNKNSIQNFKYKKILIGDLIYDEYLRSFNQITIDIKDKKFYNFIESFLSIFDFWSDYLQNNKVKAVVVSHTTYIFGIIARVAIKLEIPVYYTGTNGLYFLNKQNISRHSHKHYKNYPKIFNKLNKDLQKRLVIKAKNILSDRFLGKRDIKLLLDRDTNNISFSKKIKFRKKNKSKNKFKILVLAHQINDAVHVYGKSLFPDFYEWLNCVGKMSSEFTKYVFLLKIHPSEYSKNLIHFDNLKKKYPRLKIIQPEVSNSDLINKEGIDLVTTVYGSCGHEFPLLNIPVVNASDNGPHIGYNFNYNSKTIKEYVNFIKKADQLKIRKKYRRGIYEFYSLRFMMEFTPIKNQNYYAKKFGKNFTSNYVNIFLSQITEKRHKYIYSTIKKFVISKKFRVFFDNTDEDNGYIKNI